MFDVIILAGGLGTRLRAVIGDQQKCVAEYSGQPFLFHLLSHVYHQGLKKVILALSHDASRVSEMVDASSWSGELDIHYSVEQTPLGTAGAVKHAAKYVSTDDFIVMNGDTYTELDCKAMMRAHRARSADLTIAVTSQNPNHDSGYIDFDSNHRIKAFSEKVHQGQKYSSMGVYAMNRSLMEIIPSARACSLELDVFPHALNHAVYAYPTDLPFWDIGTVDRFKQQVSWLNH